MNDLLGHSAGDQLLRDIADTLQLTIGEHDMAARIGGDEFAVYSSDFTDIAKARERLRIMVSAMHRELQPGVSISVSAGRRSIPGTARPLRNSTGKWIWHSTMPRKPAGTGM